MEIAYCNRSCNQQALCPNACLSRAAGSTQVRSGLGAPQPWHHFSTPHKLMIQVLGTHLPGWQATIPCVLDMCIVYICSAFQANHLFFIGCISVCSKLKRRVWTAPSQRLADSRIRTNRPIMHDSKIRTSRFSETKPSHPFPHYSTVSNQPKLLVFSTECN